MEDQNSKPKPEETEEVHEPGTTQSGSGATPPTTPPETEESEDE